MKFRKSSSGCEPRPAKGEPARADSQPKTRLLPFRRPPKHARGKGETTFDFLGFSASSKGWHVQWENRPTEARIRSLVAWNTRGKETALLKLFDKAVLGTVSESPGRNASEPIGGPVKKNTWRPRRLFPSEGNMDSSQPDRGGEFTPAGW